ncbi:prefoldin subunit [Candidatus Micrarchaeota archaeon]|nr:prefoldin subunit [Candidatus Micrarchaeota archaeon]
MTESEREQQIKLLEAQVQQLDYQIKELEIAAEEVKKAEGNVYKNVGTFLVEMSKDEALKDIEERKKGLIARKDVALKHINRLKKNEEGTE